jgi:short subunit dehydrogenase-like uncharacterized protein
MIDQHHAEAEKKGVRVVPCCGYDAIPSDLGAMLVANKMAELGETPDRIITVVTAGSGGVSGGTIASGMAIAEEYKKAGKKGQKDGPPNPDDVYSLLPADAPRGSDRELRRTEACTDAGGGGWLAPFFMQACNNRIVHRSNYFNHYAPTQDFKYQEAILNKGRVAAVIAAAGTALAGTMLKSTLMHPLLRKMLPAPGEGPSREAMMTTGHWKHRVVGYGKTKAGPTGTSSPSRAVVIAEVGDAHRDPGYWCTSRMVLEAALCLALERGRLDADPKVQKGGVLTAASALGETLVGRLKAAGLELEVMEAKAAA